MKPVFNHTPPWVPDFAKKRTAPSNHFLPVPTWGATGDTLDDSGDMPFRNTDAHLVGGIPTPLKNDGVNVSWDDFPFPTEWNVI